MVPSQDRLADVLAAKMLEAKQDVSTISSTSFSQISDEEISSLLMSKHVCELPVLRSDRITRDHPFEVPVEEGYINPRYSRGIGVTINVPVEGGSEYLQFRPRGFSGSPLGFLEGSVIRQSVTAPVNDPRLLDARLSEAVHRLSEFCELVRRELLTFNDSLREELALRVRERRQERIEFEATASTIRFPLNVRDDPVLSAFPLVRKEVRLEAELDNTGSDETEHWALGDPDFEQILTLIENMARAMERSPKTFVKLKEEEIRDFFLVVLNGTYEGQATGETFNGNGHTDIRVVYGRGEVFVAECKIWDGIRLMNDTIDQLLGYITYRDRKNAIVIFNRKRNHTRVANLVWEAMTNHKNYIRERSRRNEAHRQYIYRQSGDTDRIIIIAVLVFQVPADEDDEVGS